MRKSAHVSLFTILCALALCVLPGAAQTPSPPPEKECECYRFEIEASSDSVKVGQQTVFTAKITGENTDVPTKFVWLIKGGQIVDGQGTKAIIAIADKSDENLLTATLNIGGPHRCMQTCPNAAHESVRVLAGESRTDVLSMTAKTDDPDGFIYWVSSPRPHPRRPIAPNQNANVDALELDHTELTSSCTTDAKAKGDCSESLKLNVKTTASDADGDELVYQYTVSGGKIVGQGANVKWDLSDVKPGKYTITVGVDDGCGVCGNTTTKEVVVREYDRASNQNTPELEKVTFDKDSVVLWSSLLPDWIKGCDRGNQHVTITSKVKNAGDAEIYYHYMVTGGRIIGAGSQVVWDFDGVRPQDYNVTVSISQGDISLGKSITKTIKVEECPYCPPRCECPTVTIIPSKPSVKPGNSVVFSVSVAGGNVSKPTYRWTVINGTVVAGQSTSQITVKARHDTPKEIDHTLTVELELGGACADCPGTHSKVVLISRKQQN